MIHAYVPCKSISKRIPDKNRQKINGKSLIEITLDFALKSNLFDSITISSDEDIKLGADFRNVKKHIRMPSDRNPDLNNYTVLQNIVKHSGIFSVGDLIIMLQLTHPFRRLSDLKVFLDQINHDQQSSSWVSCSRNNFRSAILSNSMNTGVFEISEIFDTFIINGQFYAFKILPDNTIESNYSGVIIPDSPFSIIDIDHPIDLEIARLLAVSFFK